MQRIGEQAFGRAGFHDLPEVQDGDVVADVLDHPEIVGDEQVAEAEIVLQPAQEVEDLCLYRDVEGGDGLVAAEEFRAAGERAGDGDALALAAGKLVREEPRLIRAQAHGLHEPPGHGGLAAAALADEPERPAPLQREGNVVRRVHEALAVEEVALHGREADV